MNGVSLLVAFAALGISSQVEMVGSQPTFVIRVESPLLDELRQGREITAEVTARDRGVRHFKILVTPEKAYQPRTLRDASGRSDSLVEYEAVQLQNQEIEIWIQIAPDRLITLAEGKYIEGQVPQEANQVHRFRVFVGTNELPRQLAPASGQAVLPGISAGGTNYNLTPAAAESRAQFDASNRAPASSAPALGARGTTAGSSGILNSIGSRIGATLRNTPDQSTAPPLLGRDSFGSSPSPPPGYSPNTAYGPTVGNQYNTYGQGNELAPLPGSPGATQQPNPYAWSPQQYGAQGNVPVPQQPSPPYQPIYTARPDSPAVQSPPPAWQTSGPTYASTQLPPQQPPPVQQPAAGQLAAAGQQLAGTPTAAGGSAITTPAATPSTVVVSREDDDRPKSSTPLILTTLALFTSLGVNAYLGWLAYSFFWRYRDAVSDSVRARSYNAPGRQAA